MDKRLTIAFGQLNIGAIYSTNELKKILKRNGLGGNIAALSVN